MSPKDVADRVVRYWHIIVAIVAIISAAAVYASTLPKLEKRVECLELWRSDVQDDISTIKTDMTWIKSALIRIEERLDNR